MENVSLIVGLGNPGSKYEKTRHNIGFMVADQLCDEALGSWSTKFNAHMAQVKLGASKVVLLKPQTYMNLSGQSVTRAMSFFKLSVSQICIIHDEIELPFGSIRLKTGGGLAGHNGLKSCKQELGTADFHRLRVGVDRPKYGDVSNYVLGNFNVDEQAEISSVLDRACDAINTVTKSGMVKAMNNFNQRQGDS